MKKIFFMCLTMIFINSCQKEEKKPEYIIVSGQLSNTKGGPLDITDLSGFSKMINVKDDGSFLDTLYVNEGLYMAVLGKQIMPMLLTKGAIIHITANAKDVSNTLTYTGDNKDINNYYAYKAKWTSRINDDMATNIALEENAYLKFINTTKADFEEQFSKVVSISDDIRKKEQRAISYYIQDQLKYYVRYHGNVTKKENFEVSDTFKAQLKEFDLNNLEDYRYSLEYNTGVLMNLMQKAQILAQKDSISNRDAEFKLINNIENDTLRELLMSRFAQMNLSFMKKDGRTDYFNKYLSFSKNSKEQEKVKKLFASLNKLEPGNPSPKFSNYENYAGGTTSLDDFKGKYVYIDVWATWCGPCKAEIPYLKEVEAKYHNKNIEFVSISVDSQKDYQKWREMIEEKKMGGAQLFADAAFNSLFIKDYNIVGIPQFILIDPEGNIVNSSAPRPSDEKLIDLFNELGI